ncbi:ABC transporter ATP-binding protein/permease [Pseudomonas alliivorans]|nr:ABC transporter ATP-binding protein/permease [Pseudomonas alliivorans]MEE4720448.1 ABC transporter ATP-binding protein/permease [Pseudomonas alliivorans]MEE4755890.1 ABC transporter ATP-binding protein/permease [Pseudomonas alliivorans]MEE4761691.1 ABC transporter ATP-binding protein/permease [Pseudomonas alliivorans]MEE4771862.1 ABC transporter ATP-binding protein/permease [Pseudomonas alliivorans]
MNTLRTFYRLAAPYWLDRRQWLSWVLLASVIGLGLLVVQVNVLINTWSKTFFDALGGFNTGALYALMGEYVIYIAAYVVIMVYLEWLRKALVLRWRRAMTASTLENWMQGQAYYRLGLTGEPDNPDQRIAEDIAVLVDRSVELLASLIINTAQVGAFAVVLWNLSGVLTVQVLGQDVKIHGYLLWIAVAYTLLGTAFTHFIGRPLQPLNYQQQRYEADFRASLLRKRDHAEQIALYRGEAVEQRQLGERFEHIAGNWWQLMNRMRKLQFFTVSYDRVSRIIPVFAALPAFLAKTITLGGLMQIRNAFQLVQGSLSWFIDVYPRLAAWSATVERLGQFQQAIEATRGQVVKPEQGAVLRVENLVIHHADGSHLLGTLNFIAGPGQWLRIAGRSGIGKSTLLRTLQGLWPYYQGSWQLPGGSSLLIPQQPYLPSLPLRQLLAYPATEYPADEVLVSVLHQVGLAQLVDSLAHEREWSRELSGGEQQRIGLARAMLCAPQTLYLDEATNQLDEPSACQLLETVRQALPNTLIIGISHQPAVARLFSRTLTLEVQERALALSDNI